MNKKNIKRTFFSFMATGLVISPIAIVTNCSCSSSDNFTPSYTYGSAINCLDPNQDGYISLADVQRSAKILTNASAFEIIDEDIAKKIIGDNEEFYNEIAASFAFYNFDENSNNIGFKLN